MLAMINMLDVKTTLIISCPVVMPAMEIIMVLLGQCTCMHVYNAPLVMHTCMIVCISS